MYLFESLPKKWTATQYLPWIKLLVFCGREAELQGNLWKVFVFFVQRSKNVGNCYSVAPLKCALLIVYALMEWLVEETLASKVFSHSLLMMAQITWDGFLGKIKVTEKGI